MSATLHRTEGSTPLLRCPFCGSGARHGYDAGNEHMDQRFWIKCSTCEASGKTFFGANIWNSGKDAIAKDAVAKEQATNWWNRRAPNQGEAS